MLLGKKRKYSLWVRNCHYHAYRRFNEDRAGGGEINVTPFGGETNDPLHTDLPEPRQSKSERKPYPTPMKTLIRRAMEEKELRKSKPCRVLEHPPDNGLLVPELVPMSHHVHWARESLIVGISKLLPFIHVLKCRVVIAELYLLRPQLRYLLRQLQKTNSKERPQLNCLRIHSCRIRDKLDLLW